MRPRKKKPRKPLRELCTRCLVRPHDMTSHCATGNHKVNVTLAEMEERGLMRAKESTVLLRNLLPSFMVVAPGMLSASVEAIDCAFAPWWAVVVARQSDVGLVMRKKVLLKLAGSVLLQTAMKVHIDLAGGQSRDWLVMMSLMPPKGPQ